MRSTRISVGLGVALAAIGCTMAAEPLDLESPEDAPVIAELGPTVPEAPAPVPTRTEHDDGWIACKLLLGDAEGLVRTELETLCQATRHDDDCVGFACARTAPREAFECLLETGQAERVIALEHADVPAARAFAREAITRVDGWSETRIRDALRDEAVVPECSGCMCLDTDLSTTGLRLLLSREDRATMQPLLAEWSASDPPPSELAEALRERPTEGWISTARLHELVAAPMQDPELRATAAYALALRGDDAGHEALYAATSHDSWQVRNLAVEGLDALDDGEAWDRLAPLLDDDTGHVRISLMRLGARLRPDDAVATLDREDFGAEAMPELPTRLFAPRAARAICAHRHVYGEPRAQLVTALERLPRQKRCQALADADRRCPWSHTRGEMIHSILPELATACGIDPPPASPIPDPPELSRCHRIRRKQEATLLRAWEAKAREIEQRAKAAADAELLELERRARQAAGLEPWGV